MQLIQKNIVAFSCNSKATANQLQETCGIFMNQYFYPKLDELLEQYDSKDERWVIEKLDILINTNLENWQKDFLEQAFHQIEQYLKTHKAYSIIEQDNISINNTSISFQAFLLFINYLKTNHLTINAINNNLDEIIINIQWQDKNVQELLALLLVDSTAFIRFLNLPLTNNKQLLYQNLFRYIKAEKSFDLFTEQHLNDCIKYIIANQDIIIFEFIILIALINKHRDEAFIEHIITLINKKYYSDFSEKYDFKKTKALLHLLLGKQENNYLNIIEKIFKEINFTDIATISEINNDDNTIDINTSATYVNNSGLILLHPFLMTFFEKVNLLENNNWINNAAQHKAVLLLQYLCTSQAIFWDNELSLNKLLCGLPINTIINTKIPILDNDKEQANILLDSVIQHWTILKNTSIEGLQSSFLMRSGKIINSMNAYELYIESKGIDILLNNLPWSFSIVKNKMMQMSIQTFWNY